MVAALVRTAEAEIQRRVSVASPVSVSPAMFHAYLARRPAQEPANQAV
jgi:hypothetical protein